MKIEIGTPKLWLLYTSGRYSEVVVNSGLTIYSFYNLSRFGSQAHAVENWMWKILWNKFCFKFLQCRYLFEQCMPKQLSTFKDKFSDLWLFIDKPFFHLRTKSHDSEILLATNCLSNFEIFFNRGASAPLQQESILAKKAFCLKG